MNGDRKPKVIELPVGMSLFEARAQPLIDHLLVESNHHEPVVLLQRQAAHDFSPTWCQEVSEELLRQEFSFRFARLLELCHKITNEGLPWVYASNGSCLGSWWILAASCRHRLWFRSDARCGPLGIEGPRSYAAQANSTVRLAREGKVRLLGDDPDWRNSVSQTAMFALATPADPPVEPLTVSPQELATAIFLPDYLLWIRDHTGLSQSYEGSACFQAVVDLGCGLPPTRVLSDLLDRGTVLHFWCASTSQLVNDMNLLYLRLERGNNGRYMQGLWRQQVYCVSGGTMPQLPRFCWLPDGRVELRRGEQLAGGIYAVGGNGADVTLRGAEIYEAFGEGFSEEMGLMRSVYEIYPWRIEYGCPNTVLLRSLFLEELIRVGQQREGDINWVLHCLEKAGWEFASDQGNWENFMQGRGVFLSERAFSSNPMALSRDIADLVLWKHVRDRAKAAAKGKATEFANPTAVSQHFERALATWVDQLAELSQNVNRLHLAAAARAALGVPTYLTGLS